MMMLKRCVSISLVLILLLSSHSVVLGNTSFKDVPSNHWANAAIQQVAAKKIIEGYPGGLFRPNNQVTRAEFAAMLVRVIPTEERKSHSFSDVPASHWANGAVEKALAVGFINANDFKEKFEPNKPLTRAEMAKWMANGLASIDAEYKQAIEDTKDTLLPIPEFYKGGLNKADIPFIAVAMGTGLLNGYQDYTFRPSGTTTRAEVAVLLTRFQNVIEKNPSDFLHLEELRAVGTTGTNMELVSDYRFRIRSFEEVRDKEIKYKGGAKIIHRMIFINLSDEDQKSIYQDVFVDKNTSKKDDTAYLVLIESTFNQTVTDAENFLWDYYRNGSDQFLVVGNRLVDRTIDVFGYNTLALNNKDFIQNNVGKRYWESTGVDRTRHAIYGIKTIDQTNMVIGN